MSQVMARLQQLASEGSSEPFDRSFIPQNQGREASQELDQIMQSVPIPGESLTTDPEQPMPWETPPEFTDVNEFMEYLFDYLIEPEILPDLLTAMRTKYPVEEMTQDILQGAFRGGKINMDLLLLSIEPTMYMLISLATAAMIDPVVAPEIPDEDEMEENEASMLEGLRDTSKFAKELKKNPQSGINIEELPVPTAAPKSLLARSEQAVQSIKE